MILVIPKVLNADQVRHVRDTLAGAEWEDGALTAGAQSASVKANLQAREASHAARTLGDLILDALSRNATFMSAALPLRVYPPMFNRYGPGMGFGNHIDNAVRPSRQTGLRYRTDLAGTLFLADPGDYDGGELSTEAAGRQTRVKLPAGDLVLYPASTVHRVETVTRGERWASIFWVQSMVADQSRRTLLYDLDTAIVSARADLGDGHPASVSLTGTYHNLIRMWARV
jgi:PKHD-type hydroxylase